MSELIFVCDLEATCWVDGESPPIDEMEVIEIGCVLCDMNGNIVDEFMSFVRPIKNPTLSDFCKQLTSIKQMDVDNAPEFTEVMHMLDKWCATRSEIWSSWGNYDRNLLLNQEQRTKNSFIFSNMPHVNLKKAWRRTTKHRGHCGLQAALSFHGIEFDGTPHRAISDAKNTALLLPYITSSEINRQLENDGQV